MEPGKLPPCFEGALLRTLGGCMKAAMIAINEDVEVYGGDDGARTRDLCRDSEFETRNVLKQQRNGWLFWRYWKHLGTVIVSLSCPRFLARPLPKVGRGRGGQYIFVYCDWLRMLRLYGTIDLRCLRCPRLFCPQLFLPKRMHILPRRRAPACTPYAFSDSA